MFKVVKIFAIGVRVILYFRHGNYSMKRRSENRLIKMARYATITHPIGSGGDGLGADLGARKGRNVASQSRKTRRNI